MNEPEPRLQLDALTELVLEVPLSSTSVTYWTSPAPCSSARPGAGRVPARLRGLPFGVPAGELNVGGA
ncbi:MAG TPA: hypothetical protein VHN80_29135 [Kineosporiaceae bacterium]|nr:hypothetical protein [Kineosporiaceae bacterium]